MTKAEITDSVLLRLSGGRMSNDVDVRREDIAVLVDGAIAEVLKEQADEEKNKDITRLRYLGHKGNDPITYYAVTKRLTPQLDSDRDQYYIDLGGRVFVGAGRTGVAGIKPLKGSKVYKPASSAAAISAIPENMGLVFYWIETVDGNSYLYFNTLSTPVCEHLIQVYVSPSDLGAEDQLPVPEYILLEVVRRLTRFFSQEHPQDQEMTDTDESRAQ